MKRTPPQAGERLCGRLQLRRIVGLLGYSLLFTINQDPNSLPRIGVGAFLVLASFLTLAWRGIYIRLYTSSGLMRRVLIIGAGKGGHSLVGYLLQTQSASISFGWIY